MRTLLIILIALTACGPREINPETETVAKNGKVVELIVEHEGCKLYGVRPCSSCYTVYFSNCGDTQTTVRHGKSSRQVQVNGESK
jgi:hypothetical protein